MMNPLLIVNGHSHGFRRARSFKDPRPANETILCERKGFLTPPSFRVIQHCDYSAGIRPEQIASEWLHPNVEDRQILPQSTPSSSPELLVRSFTENGFSSLLKQEVFKNDVKCQKKIIRELLVCRQSSAPVHLGTTASESGCFTPAIKNETETDISSTAMPFARRTYGRTVSWPNNDGTTAADTSVTVPVRSSSDSEVLEPFQVLSTFKRKPPSYWVGCLFRFVPGQSKLEITLRQTGVLPDILTKCKFSKLSVCVQLPDVSSRNFVLVKSRKDVSFRSHLMFFDAKDKDAVRQKALELKLYHHSKVFLKKCIAEWKIPLDRCTEVTKTEWHRYSAPGL